MPLRLRDPNLVLDLEFSFAAFRNGIRDDAPMSEIKSSAAEIRAGLLDVDRTLADKGFAAPALAFAFAFVILFREGVEVVLLLAILLGALSAGRASGYRKPLAAGVIAALGATALTWVLATAVLEIAPVQRELLEGITAVLAVVGPLRRQLLARLEARPQALARVHARAGRVGDRGRAAPRPSRGSASRPSTARASRPSSSTRRSRSSRRASGSTSRSASAPRRSRSPRVAYVVLKLGRRIPVKPMLTAGAATLLLLSVTFAGNAVRSLQGADWVSITPVQADWARLPIFLAELTGIHPTREGLTVQAVLLTVYVLGAAWVFAIRPWRRRTAQAVGA